MIGRKSTSNPNDCRECVTAIGSEIFNLTKVYVLKVISKNLYAALCQQELQCIVSGSLTVADLGPVVESLEHEILLQTIYRTYDFDESHDLPW